MATHLFYRLTPFIIFASSLSATVSASDVLVSANFNVGQGFHYRVNDTCYVVTPNHVLGDAQSANIMLPTRQYQTAELEQSFDVDVAILKATTPMALCNANSFLQVSDLNKLLGVYQDGVLKTRLADGSVLQTKVVIQAVDDSEFLAIKPERSDEAFKQGYSGSILFVAEQAAGVLLEVDDQGGIVYRADALTELLNDYFDVSSKVATSNQTAESSASDEDVTTTNTRLEGRIAKNQIKDYNVSMLGNSPIEFVLKATEAGEAKYSVQVLDKRENELLDYNFWTTRSYNFAFTPPQDDDFIVRVKGLQSFGEYDIQMSDYSYDAELRGSGNELTIPAQISPKIALDAVAEYRFNGEKNSPVEFTLDEISGDDFKYSVRIIDNEGNRLQDYDFWSHRTYNYAFTPEHTGTYVLQVVGLQHYGQPNISISQWTTNAELMSAQNVVAAGDAVVGKLAKNAVTEYRMMMTANAPIDFKLEEVSPEIKYHLEIFDETGSRKYSGDFWTHRDNRFVFTPLSSDVHVIRITGLQDHGTFNFKLFDYD